ncbi:MAG: prepilin-type N-terminal cleavage/methylation domain-containing protein [Dehalococcoidales bacterium]
MSALTGLNVMRWLLKERFKIFRQQTGFTLVEVLVAIGILSAIAVGLLSALQTNAKSTRNLDERVEAANLATAYMETIKELPYAATYPSVGDYVTVPFQYEVVVETECSSDGTNFGPCTGSDNETLQKITVNVSREGRPVFSLCTYRTKR